MADAQLLNAVAVLCYSAAELTWRSGVGRLFLATKKTGAISTDAVVISTPRRHPAWPLWRGACGTTRR